MSVRVKLPAMFQPAANGAKMVEVNNCNTVGECLKELRSQSPPLGKMLFDEGDNIAGFLMIFINEQGIDHGTDRFSIPVKDGDEIYPIMMIEGG